MAAHSSARDPAGLSRRLAAMAYDLLLLAALAAVATFAFLPLSGGEALLVRTQGPLAHVYHATQLLLALGYFGISWTRGGQTLGMRAWRIRLQAAGGGAANWPDAIVRFTIGAALLMLAAVGLWELRTTHSPLHTACALLLLLPALANLAWIACDRGHRSLQDIAGGLRVVRSA